LFILNKIAKGGVLFILMLAHGIAKGGVLFILMLAHGIAVAEFCSS
jgi:hypothetical protein